jgi:hypothetical protein
VNICWGNIVIFEYRELVLDVKGKWIIARKGLDQPPHKAMERLR